MRKVAALLLASSVFAGTAGAQDDVESLTCADFLEMDEVAQEEALSALEVIGPDGGSGVVDDLSTDTTSADNATDSETAKDSSIANSNGEDGVADTTSPDGVASDAIAANGANDDMSIDTDEGDLSVDLDFSSVIAACEGDPTLTVQAVLQQESD